MRASNSVHWELWRGELGAVEGEWGGFGDNAQAYSNAYGYLFRSPNPNRGVCWMLPLGEPAFACCRHDDPPCFAIAGTCLVGCSCFWRF